VSAKEAAAYHSRREVEVEVARRLLRGRRADYVLKRFVERGRFGYVVMGGFGRPPVMESLLGSVTCAMIAASGVPLFLASRELKRGQKSCATATRRKAGAAEKRSRRAAPARRRPYPRRPHPCAMRQ
jgi:hypothetical protein